MSWRMKNTDLIDSGPCRLAGGAGGGINYNEKNRGDSYLWNHGH
jgi:hypothetical protein